MEAASIYACRDEGELELAQDYWEPLKQFYAGAAAVGDAMLLYIK
jgi:hypothetical protein